MKDLKELNPKDDSKFTQSVVLNNFAIAINNIVTVIIEGIKKAQGS